MNRLRKIKAYTAPVMRVDFDFRVRVYMYRRISDQRWESRVCSDFSRWFDWILPVAAMLSCIIWLLIRLGRLYTYNRKKNTSHAMFIYHCNCCCSSQVCAQLECIPSVSHSLARLFFLSVPRLFSCINSVTWASASSLAYRNICYFGALTLTHIPSQSSEIFGISIFFPSSLFRITLVLIVSSRPS